MSETQLTCSAIIPVYAGSRYLSDLVRELDELRDRWARENSPVQFSEAVFVLDDPVDDSSRVLEELARQHPWVRAIALSRNFGQHPATQAGILHTSSDWVVTMDEDLQHRPAMIPELFRRVAEDDADIVYASPTNPVHRSLVRDAGSRFYKWLISKLTGNRNVRDFNSFRLIRGSVARAASSVCSHDTYFDIALSWFTARVGVESMDLVDRRFVEVKQSGYSIIKLFSHARRMILSAQVKALRFGLLLGLGGLLFGLLYGLRIVGSQLFLDVRPTVEGWSSLMVVFLFYSGIITLMLGIILEFISLLVLHIQGKPVFFIVDRSSDPRLLPYFARDQHESA